VLEAPAILGTLKEAAEVDALISRVIPVAPVLLVSFLTTLAARNPESVGLLAAPKVTTSPLVPEKETPFILVTVTALEPLVVASPLSSAAVIGLPPLRIPVRARLGVTRVGEVALTIFPDPVKAMIERVPGVPFPSLAIAPAASAVGTCH
jgi:hypothetical protein